MKRGKTLNSFLVFKYRLRSTINTIFEFVNRPCTRDLIVLANAVSVAIGDNGNRLIFKIWWNFFYDLFSIKNVADVNNIDSFVRKRNMEEFSVVIMKRFRSNWFEKTKARHVTYNNRQSVLRRTRIDVSFVNCSVFISFV
jgi:hypothetical protein